MHKMNTIPNRQVICDTLLELAQDDRDIMVLASDSRGSAAMAPFAKAFPEQFVEVGIAEQNIVGISAGLAHSGKKPFVTSPACFLSMRSIEQIKVDVAYSSDQCEAGRHQRWCQLRSAWHVPSFCAGFAVIGRYLDSLLCCRLIAMKRSG